MSIALITAASLGLVGCCTTMLACLSVPSGRAERRPSGRRPLARG